MSELTNINPETDKKDLEDLSKNFIENKELEAIGLMINDQNKINEENNNNENANNFDNLFDLNLQNFLDNLTKDDKKKKTNNEEENLNESILKNSQVMDKMDESIVDLKDKDFLNKLNYLTKKQRKIDRLGNDCFLNNDNDIRFDEDLEDLIDLYKNKEHKIVINNIDDDNVSIRITDKSLINFNLNMSKLTVTNDINGEDSLLDRNINNTILDNTFLAMPKPREMDINMINQVNIEERAKKYDFEKINEMIIYEDKKINQLKSLTAEYDMQNEEIQGQYLQLMQRKKFFPYKDQNLRNFSIVLNMQLFKNPNPVEIFDTKNFYKYDEMNKNKEEFIKGSDIEDNFIEINALHENYKANFNFNKFEIVECFDDKLLEKKTENKNRKINSTLLHRIKITDKAKLLKNFVSKNNNNYADNNTIKETINYIKNNTNINNEYKKEKKIDNTKLINIKINFDNLNIKKKLTALVNKKYTKENIIDLIEKLFLNEKLVKEKISLWSKKSYNDNSDEYDYNFLPEEKRKYYNNDKIDVKFFNNYFVSLYENDKNKINNKNNNTNKNQNIPISKFFSNENEDMFNLENIVPQIFDDISLPLEKITEIIKGKTITNENINEIDKNILEKIKNLNELELKIDELSEINNFHLFENLTKIYLGGNQLTNLNFLKNLGNNNFNKNSHSNNIIDPFKYSNLINSNENLDSNISNYFINNCFDKLLELNFPQNNIKIIDKSIFDKLMNLRVLNLEMNVIGKIQNLENCRFLTTLNLAYNKIEQLENLDNLISLEKLLLNGNSIKKIENLSKLKKLKHLSLGLNKIKDLENIENEIFYLEELILYENKLKSIPENFSLPFLKNFYLNKNKIKQIPNFFLPNLEEFFLQENKIFSITCDNKLINYCNKIRKIDLSHNKLDNFSDVINLLCYCKNIQVINVNNNPFYVNLNKIINVENALSKIFKNYKKSDYENLVNKNNSNIDSNSNFNEELKNKLNSIFLNPSIHTTDNILNKGNDILLEKETSNKLLGDNSYLKEEIRILEDNENSQNIIINQIINLKLERENNENYSNSNEFDKANLNNEESINEENFELLFDLLKTKKRKEEIFKKHLDDLFIYFNNQHTNFLNIFTSKFSQISFFGKNLSFNKNISFEKYFLLDIFNNSYSKSKNKFLCLLYDILKDKNNKAINSKKDFDKAKILHAKLNENKINEENFKKYIFNLKNILEYLSTFSSKITNNFRSRKNKVLKIQNNFRGFKIRNYLNKKIECFNFLKHTNKILKIQNAFRKNYFRKKFLKNFNKLKLFEEEDNNLDDNIQNFFMDDGNIDIQDTYLQNLNQNPEKNINLHMSIIKEEPELKEDNEGENLINNNNEINNAVKNNIENKLPNKSEREIMDRIKNLEKSIKINEKLANELKPIPDDNKKVSYNLNIGLNSKNNLAHAINNNSGNKLNPINTKNRSNAMNKVETNINVVNMNNVDFLQDPKSNFNELKAVFRDQNSNFVPNANNNINQKPKLPHLNNANKQSLSDNSLGNLNNEINYNSNEDNRNNLIKLPLIKNSSNLKKLETPNSITSENSVKFTSNINILNKKRESNSLTSSNDNFSVKNFSHISNTNSNNKEDLERSYKSYNKKSDNIYVGGRLLPTKVVEEIRIIEHECREAIKNAKSEWKLQNHLAEELLIKKIKKQYKKKIEKLIQNSHG